MYTTVDYLLEQLNIAERIVDDTRVAWKVNYDIIFGEIAKTVNMYTNFDYYDPDSTYEEDVRAYVAALRRHLTTIENDSDN